MLRRRAQRALNPFMMTCPAIHSVKHMKPETVPDCSVSLLESPTIAAALNRMPGWAAFAYVRSRMSGKLGTFLLRSSFHWKHCII